MTILQIILQSHGSSFGLFQLLILIVIAVIIILVIKFVKNNRKVGNIASDTGKPKRIKFTTSIILLIFGVVLIIVSKQSIHSQLIWQLAQTNTDAAEKGMTALLIVGIAFLIIGGILLAINISKLANSNNKDLKSDDQISKLEKLAKLKDQGVINEEEFNIQKNKILNQ